MHAQRQLAGMIPGLLVVALALSGVSLLAAPQDTPRATDQIFTQPPTSAAPEAKKPEEKKEKDKPFDEVVKDMEKIEGLFTFYQDKEENKVLLELLPDQLDKDYIVSVKVEQATGERGLYGTIMAEEGIIQWHRLGKRVQLVLKNIRFRAKPGSPAARAVEKSFSDSLLGSAKLQSLPHPERKSVLVDLGEILLAGDVHGVAPYLKQIYKGGYRFDKENSGFLMVKSFPRNSELGTVAQFQAQELERGSVTIPDPRSLSLRFRYSLLGVPQNDYLPRLADDRVGYFVDQYMDFTSDKPDTPYVRFINRWNLKKKDPKAGVSEPVEPIVFWLENSIPVEYREAIRDGILLWNPAFEKAGFKNAMVVKQQPEDADWDPADMRYNTIRWFVGYDASFAIGPSHSNPYTGQLLDADIGISEGILRLGARRRYQLYINPVARVQELLGEPQSFAGRFGQPDPRYLCNYGDGLVEQASVAYDVLAGRPDWNPEKEKEFIRQYVMELLAHEVGHTLGLRHNFRASIINRMDQLGDTQRTHAVGLAASVMDYNPAIVALKGERQGDYLPTVVGSYDQWAIEYGYKPLPQAKTSEEELPELSRIASRAADPLLPYGTDEDTYSGARVIDPRNYPYDFSDQPLDYFAHEYKVIRELWTNMEGKLVGAGDSYEILRRAFDYTWSPYVRGTVVATKYIGGIYHNRDHAGDPGGRLPYVPAPAAEQRRALEFLGKEVWGPDVFRVQGDLLNKLQIERQQSFEFLGWTSSRLDYPLHDWVLTVQGAPLNSLYDPIRLARLQDLELKYANPGDCFTLADMFVGVRQAIWSELDSGVPINSFRRNLQREHLRHLIELVLKPAAGTPEDAVTLARADLVELEGKIDRVLAGGQPAAAGQLDHTNRAHLEETRARIRQVLEAQVQRGL